MSNTVVSATATDPTGQAWINGTITWQLYAARPVFFNGTQLPDSAFLPQSEPLDNTGSATFSVMDNAQMTPAGAVYRITVNPNATAEGITIYLYITGANMNITSQVNAAIAQPQVIPAAISTAYRDTNVFPVNGIGALYYNTGSETGLRVYTEAGWEPVGGGGVTQIVAGINVTISPPSGLGVVTINASGTGITGLNGDVSAGVAPFTPSTVLEVHATNGSNLTLKIDPTLSKGLGLYFDDSTNSYLATLYSDPTTYQGPTLSLQNHSSLGAINVTTDGFNLIADQLGDGTLAQVFIQNPNDSQELQLGTEVVTGISNIVAPMGVGANTGSLLLHAIGGDMYLYCDATSGNLPLVRAQLFAADSGISYGASQSANADPITFAGATIIKITGNFTLNTITPHPSFVAVSHDYTQVIVLIAISSFTVGTSGNIATPFTAKVGQAYTGYYDPTTSKWYFSITNTPALSSTTLTVGTQYQNTSSTLQYISGWATVTGGAGDSQISVSMGASSASTVIYEDTMTGTGSGEPMGFFFAVPPGWYYEINGSGHISGTATANILSY